MKGFFDRGLRQTHQRSPVILPESVLTKVEKTRRDYATLCGATATTESVRDMRIKKGYVDFLRIVSDPRIEEILVDLKKLVLHVGTAPVILTDLEGKKRLIGQFIVSMIAAPAKFEFQNVNNPLGSGEALHPHIYEGGNICMSKGTQESLTAIVDGNFFFATGMLVTALNTLSSSPLKVVTSWPEYKEKIDGN